MSYQEFKIDLMINKGEEEFAFDVAYTNGVSKTKIVLWTLKYMLTRRVW